MADAKIADGTVADGKPTDSNVYHGRVKWFNNAKGFGFIENSEGDVFVHYSVIEADGFRSLKDGDEVVYEVQRGPKGLQASKVSKAKSDDATQADSSAPASSASLNPTPANVASTTSLENSVSVIQEASVDISASVTALQGSDVVIAANETAK